MGANQSAPAPGARAAAAPLIDEPTRREEIARELAELRIASGPSDGQGVLRNPHAAAHVKLSAIADWKARAEARPGQALASTLLHKQDLNAALLSRAAVVADQHVYNTAIPHEGTPVTNQKSSGRCWLFATTNIARLAVVKNLGIDGPFELSQAYLFAWDCVEKANWFLELAIELADEPLDGRTLQYLMQDPQNDGGQWDMVVSACRRAWALLTSSDLIERFGLVPKAVYPESFHSSNTSRLDELLTHKLREFALVLRRLRASTKTTSTHAEWLQSARSVKAEQMATIYDIVATCCGTMPMPDAKFTFEYRDKNGKVRRIECTPLEFAKIHAAPFNPASHISLINDPRNAYGQLYTVKHLGNVYGARPVLYVNAPSSTLLDVVVARIKQGEPVWFGCDVGACSDSTRGLMDPSLRDYKAAFGTTLGLTKSERLQTGDSSMTHAMVFTAVHLDEAGQVVRLRVENSWSDDRGDKGYFLCTRAWFDAYVFQIVAPRDTVPKELREVFEHGTPHVLPPWDPMGTLA